MRQEGNGFSSELREFKVPGGLQVGNAIGSGGVLSVNSIWLPVNLNSQISFPHSPKGFWGLVLLALTGPHRPFPVTLTHHTPLKLLHLIPPRGGDGRGGLPVESFIFLLTSHLAAKECSLRLFLFSPFLSRGKDQE